MPLGALNSDIFKYFLLLCTAPLWFPFVKAILKELNDALASEGGLFGRPPTPTERQAIERDPNLAPSPLVSRDRDPDDPRQPLGGDRAGSRRAAGTGAQAAARPAAHSAGGTRGGSIAAAGFSKPRAARGFARRDERGT